MMCLPKVVHSNSDFACKTKQDRPNMLNKRLRDYSI